MVNLYVKNCEKCGDLLDQKDLKECENCEYKLCPKCYGQGKEMCERCTLINEKDIEDFFEEEVDWEEIKRFEREEDDWLNS